MVGSRNSADSTGPETSEFGSFLFWRNPLPSIEEDLQDLLVRSLAFFPFFLPHWDTGTTFISAAWEGSVLSRSSPNWSLSHRKRMLLLLCRRTPKATRVVVRRRSRVERTVMMKKAGSRPATSSRSNRAWARLMSQLVCRLAVSPPTLPCRQVWTM